MLEIFFSYIRGMGGGNENPTPVDFMCRLRWYILGKHSSIALTLNMKKYALRQFLFSSIIDASGNDVPDEDDHQLALLQFPRSNVKVQVELPNRIHLEGLQFVAHRFRLKYLHLGIDTSQIPVASTALNWIHFLPKGNLLMPCARLFFTRLTY